jgi:hypothetical protein
LRLVEKLVSLVLKGALVESGRYGNERRRSDPRWESDGERVAQERGKGG